MFEHRHYVLVVRAKAAEFYALKNLAEKRRQRITPFVVVPDIGKDWDADRSGDTYKKPLHEHLTAKANKLADCWPQDDSLFVDLAQLPHATVDDTGEHPVVYFFDKLRDHSLSAVPVTAPDRSAAFQEAVREVVSRDGNGLCLRLSQQYWEESESPRMDVGALYGRAGVQRSAVDIIFDFGPLEGKSASDVRRAAQEYITGLPSVSSWRSLTVAATSFPEDMTGIEENSVERIPREEWEAWSELTANEDEEDLDRKPAFGDYTITSRLGALEVPPDVLNIAPRLRYTLEEEWVVYRGSANEGYEQRIECAETLVDSDHFMGEDHCPGDQTMVERTGEDATSGGPQQWLEADLIHHLAVTSDQVANHS